MASTRHPLTEFILTPQQQSLLYAALNSNKPATASPVNGNGALNLSPSSYTDSPHQNGLQESPFIDYDLDFSNADTSFDFSFADDSQAKMIGDLPGSAGSADSAHGDSENNDAEKRSHPDDEQDEEEGTAKRQETGEKAPKKPGRKPLTTEPTSKRKAQNRAAQRAFRERKEKHLKDLETKVEELEKASQSANNENTMLRAQVEKISNELNEYKKRLSVLSSNRIPHPGNEKRHAFGNAAISNLNDVNFQFEFPKFGQLPGPSPTSSSNAAKSGRPAASPNSTRSPSDHVSPTDRSSTRHGSTTTQASGLDAQAKEDLAKFSGIFSPPLTNNNVASAGRGSTDSHNSGAPTSTSSPSASSNSNGGTSSSCGTSPEPSNHSPMGFKPVDTLTTIGEENHLSFGNQNQDFGHFANLDMNDMNFMSNNSNFQFDPQLFGGYREPQDNILNTGMDDSFFNDAFDIDFTTPYFAPPTAPQPKQDLVSQIDAAKNDDETQLVQTNDGQYLTCNKIWEKLQNCPQVQSGDFDLDGLCSDLQKKAKCSGSGVVVDEQTFTTVVKKYLGKDKDEQGGCPNQVKSETQA